MADLVAVDHRAGDLALSEELIDITKGYLREARSESTRRAYARGWDCFETWCDAHGRSALPASPDTVVAWMSALASGVGVRRAWARASINQALSAVLLKHRQQ